MGANGMARNPGRREGGDLIYAGKVEPGVDAAPTRKLQVQLKLQILTAFRQAHYSPRRLGCESARGLNADLRSNLLIYLSFGLQY
jgi:hypothetical protein